MASEKIITGGEANTLAGSSIFYNEEKCLTCNELTANGFTVNSTYSSDQLVKVSDVTSANSPRLVFATYMYKYQIDQANINYPIEYIIGVYPNNVDSFPGYNSGSTKQSISLGAGEAAGGSRTNFTLGFPMNSQTQTIEIYIYKNANDIFSANLTYYFIIDGVNQTSTSTRFVNQVRIEISASQFRNHSNITLNLEIQVLDTPRRSGTPSSSSVPKQASTFKSEIKEILNKD